MDPHFFIHFSDAFNLVMFIRMYQELLTWTQADPLVSPEALPEVVSRALSSALPRAVAAHLQRAPSLSPAASVPMHKAKGSVNNEKISVATFGVALCIVAMQVRTKSALFRLFV